MQYITDIVFWKVIFGSFFFILTISILAYGPKDVLKLLKPKETKNPWEDWIRFNSAWDEIKGEKIYGETPVHQIKRRRTRNGTYDRRTKQT